MIEEEEEINIDQIINKLTCLFKNPLTTISARQICGILHLAGQIFLNEDSLLKVHAPIKICGDIHGQFHDLLHLFQIQGYPSESNSYLFLGDYVDRGKRSTETFCLLAAYKIKYPSNIFLLRGNHEEAEINKYYGFYDECKRRASIKLWKRYVDCFRKLPLAALVSGTILCMHGGISQYSDKLQEIDQIQRPCVIPSQGLIADLLWADPCDMQQQFRPSNRKISFLFNRKATQRYMIQNELSLIVRAHQVVEDGFKFMFDKKIVTIFSAPNYCGRFKNKSGVLNVKENLQCSFILLCAVKIKRCRKKDKNSELSKIQPKIQEDNQSETNSKQIKKRPDSPDPNIKEVKQKIIAKIQRIKSQKIQALKKLDCFKIKKNEPVILKKQQQDQEQEIYSETQIKHERYEWKQQEQMFQNLNIKVQEEQQEDYGIELEQDDFKN